MSGQAITPAEQVDALLAELEHTRRQLNAARADVRHWQREAMKARNEADHWRALVESRAEFDGQLAAIREGRA